jgi:lipopolysaccharide export system protein LptA
LRHNKGQGTKDKQAKLSAVPMFSRLTSFTSSKRTGSIAPWVSWLCGLMFGGTIVYLLFFAPDEVKNKTTGPNSLPLAQSENLRMLQLRDENGQLTFEMSARLITIGAQGASQDFVTADDVTRAVYYQNGKPSLQIKAKHVRLNQVTRDVQANGQVGATGQDGFFVRSERVNWTNHKKELRSPVAVQAGLRGNTFQAPELSYNIKSGVLHCPEQSRAQFGQLSVEAKEIVYDSVKGVLLCPQKVTARTATLEATSTGVSYEIKGGVLRCPQSVTANTAGVVVTSTGVTYETKGGILRCPQSVMAQASGASMRSGSALINTISRRVQLRRGVKIHVPRGANLQQLQNLPVELARVAPTQGETVKSKNLSFYSGLWLLASTSLAANVTLAQKPADKPANADRKRVDVGDVHITSDQLDYVKSQSLFILKGNVVVRQDGEDMVVRSDNAIYRRDANTATATGNLKVDTRDSTITGINLDADFDSKHVVITKNVFMRSHGEKDGLPEKEKQKKDPAAAVDALSRKPSNMWCDKMDFNYDIQEAVVTGNIKIKQDKTNGTCKQVIFDEANNRAELKGNVVFVDDEGQEFKCELMRVWFDTGNIKVLSAYEFKSPRKEDKNAPAKGQPDKSTVPPKKHEFGDEPKLPDGVLPANEDAKADAKADAKTDVKTEKKEEKAQ